MKSKTINRGHLKNKIKKNAYIARCTGRYTDDYAYDSQTNFGETGWMPAIIAFTFEEWLKANNYQYDRQLAWEYSMGKNTSKEAYSQYKISKAYSDYRDAAYSLGIVFDSTDLRTQSGGAYENSDGNISLYIHSNLSYELKPVAAN